MIKIIKKNEPYFFSQIRKKVLFYKDFDNIEQKRNVRKHILNTEQNNICCYCEIEIDEFNSSIEHIIPQSKNQSLSMNYDNFVVSCNNTNHCNNFRGNNEIDINQTIENPEDFLTYNIIGEILNINQKGLKTVTNLNLNYKSLIQQRKNIIIQFGKLKNSYTKEEIIDIFQNKFPTLLNYLIKNYY